MTGAATAFPDAMQVTRDVVADSLALADLTHDLLSRYDDLYDVLNAHATSAGDALQGDIFQATLDRVGWDDILHVLASVHDWLERFVDNAPSYGDDPVALRALCRARSARRDALVVAVEDVP